MAVALPSPLSGAEQGRIAYDAVTAALEAHPFAEAKAVQYWVMFVCLGPRPRHIDLNKVIPMFVPIWEGTIEALGLRPEDKLLCTYTQRKAEVLGVRIEISRQRLRE